jgi:uncharacterized repeat protein (TIGR03803 family)
LAAAPACAEPAYRIIHNFDGAAGGANPNQILGWQSAPSFPSSWALYGTTIFGGDTVSTACQGMGSGCGVAFKLSPPHGRVGRWTEERLHVFAGGADGANAGAGLVADATGTLYGTTGNGGRPVGGGTVFALSPRKTGGWAHTVLYRFGNAPDGVVPVGGLAIAGAPVSRHAGALYGTTLYGGAAGYGSVFRLSPPRPGGKDWKETVLHAFTGNTVEGGYPLAPLIIDAAGTLYGTVNFGGGWGNGTAFALSPPVVGASDWTETVLTSFDGPDGVYPAAGLISDASGALYGTTTMGGVRGEGAVFKLTPPAAGATGWTETVLHSFTGGTDGGIVPHPLAIDSHGALYGVAVTGGDLSCFFGQGCGVVFKLSPPAKGSTVWTETVLHAFTGGTDGGLYAKSPGAGLIWGPDGRLYGTTYQGGLHGAGTVFTIKP